MSVHHPNQTTFLSPPIVEEGFLREPFFVYRGHEPRLIAAASPASIEMPFTISGKAECRLSYFFLVVFLVAFFFIALFSLGLDLVAAEPGFFIAAIFHLPPIAVAAAGRAFQLISSRTIWGHYRNMLCANQVLVDQNLERNFKCELSLF
jgi:hypothetical protein